MFSAARVLLRPGNDERTGGGGRWSGTPLAKRSAEFLHQNDLCTISQNFVGMAPGPDPRPGGSLEDGMVQPEADRTHAELPNEDSLCRASEMFWKLEGRGGRDDVPPQPTGNRALRVTSTRTRRWQKNLNLAYFAWTRIAAQPEASRQDQERSR